jgi:Tfp pilus assembly protein PilX
LKAKHLIKNEDGMIMFTTLMLLFLITIMGMSSIASSTFEIQISDNERKYQNDFYVADSGWKQAVLWIENRVSPPATVNSGSDNIVRNYGNGGTDVLNDGFSAGTEDGTINGIPYWYKVVNLPDESMKAVAGYGSDYRRFTYEATCNANGTQEIAVKLTKIFKLGY